MENILKISPEVSVVVGPFSPENVKKAELEGYQSILNLQAPDEQSFFSDEDEMAEKHGLNYKNIPVTMDKLNDEVASRVISELDRLPKPTLVHCASGRRAGAMALMRESVKNGWSSDEAFEKGNSLGFNCDEIPQMKQFFAHYVDKSAEKSNSAHS